MQSIKEIISDSSLAIGRIVYAKLRGYISAWPAIIEDTQGKKFKVRFFGDSLSWCVKLLSSYLNRCSSIFNGCSSFRFLAWKKANKISLDAPLSVQNTKHSKLSKTIGEMTFSQVRAVRLTQQHTQISITAPKEYNQLSVSSEASSISNEMVNVNEEYSSTLQTSKASSSALVGKHQRICDVAVLDVEPCQSNLSAHENNRIGGPINRMARPILIEKRKKSSGCYNKKEATTPQQSVVGPRVITRSVSARIEREVNLKRICTRSQSRLLTSSNMSIADSIF